MKKAIALVLAIFILTQANAQKESFDIASFIPPTGWQRADSNGVLLFYDYKTNNEVTSFCQLLIFPSRTSKNTALKNFQEEWKNRIAKTTGSNAKPQTETEKTPDGWTNIKGVIPITQNGITYACMLITATGFGKTMSVRINIAGQDHLVQVESFLTNFDLNKDAVSKNNIATSTSGSLSDYAFLAPQGWQTQNNKEDILLQNMQSGCMIRILSPQPSSGNLEQDAKAVFDVMYTGWQYRFTGEKKYDLAKGYTVQGLEYCMMEAPMEKPGGSGNSTYEDGASLVIKTGNKIAIIAVRHATLMMGHIDCRNKYDTWRRFFNSFTIKNQTIPKNTEETATKRIIGVWKLAESGAALGEYVFAANSNYQLVGGLGSSTTTSDQHYKYIHTTSYAFKGDGKYSINGNKLNFSKHSNNKTEEAKFRFDKVNHGGIGWKDRLFLLQVGATDGKEYEVRYEKSDN